MHFPAFNPDRSGNLFIPILPIFSFCDKSTRYVPDRVTLDATKCTGTVRCGRDPDERAVILSVDLGTIPAQEKSPEIGNGRADQ
jgi:hypothetical protein